MNLTERGEQNM